ncbi:MAG: hypothetical protein PHE25_00345 [Candidatus Gracilibacteria bacterium]|nr:hypothetical protein [Candidatus Gracilibacteria bacterium]
MSYKISAKNRRLKRTLLGIIGILKFESFNIEAPKKLVLFGVIIGFISLFMNWTESTNLNHIGNSFKSILGLTGYILFIINIKIFFIIFSKTLKELMKSYFNFNIKDGIIIIFLGVFGLFFTINSLFVIQNFSYFTDGILIGKGVIVSIIGYIFIIIGGIWLMNLKTNTSIYIEGFEETDNDKHGDKDDLSKNNMKLPF